MGYRDESDALRAKLAAKEAELAEANAKLAAFQGEAPTEKANAFLGAPTKLVVERTFARPMSEELLEGIVRILRERSDNLGRMERLGDTVSWTSTPQGGSAHQPLEVTIERRGDETFVRIRERLGQYAGGIYGGLVGGLGGGGMPGVIGLSLALSLSPIAIPMIAFAWVGAVYLGARGIYKSVVTRHAKRNAGTMAAIAELMGAPRVRAPDESSVPAEEAHELFEEEEQPSKLERLEDA
ncbi:MAG: hypothetical protein AB8H86_09045 [Polyangiales bacterium]